MLPLFLINCGLGGLDPSINLSFLYREMFSSLLLPKEYFNHIFSYLDNSSIYNCLFINRPLCRLIVPIIWRDPFEFNPKPSLISTLIACRTGDEEDKFFPTVFRTMKFNGSIPLFDYGNFVKVIRNECCVDVTRAWLESLNLKLKKRSRRSIVKKLVNII